MQLFYDDFSAVGGRQHNEDAHWIGRFEERFLFLVADGLGGYSGGGSASKAAIETVRAYYEAVPAPDPPEAVRLANDRVLALQKETGGRMKTTLALAEVSADGVYLVHIGDTRIYAFLRGELVYQSVDHSAAQMAVLSGHLSPQELRSSPDRNLLTRALGAQETVRAEEIRLKSDEYDALLLCTDGFWEPILEVEMVQTLKNTHTPADWLCALRKNLPAHEGDNQTAIAVRKEQDGCTVCTV